MPRRALKTGSLALPFANQSRYNIASLQPEVLSQDIFAYSRLLRVNEIQLVNRRIGKVPNSNYGNQPDTVLDLRIFFMKSSEDVKQSQLNYLVVRKWSGLEYKKKRVKNPVVHVYLSVDFFYSIYIEKINKAGKIENALKASFPAETSSIVVKEIEGIIEITYIEKGLLWDSKKKIKVQFSPDTVDEFVMHHHQAKEMCTESSSEKQKPIKTNPKEQPKIPVHQSSIQLNTQNNTAPLEPVLPKKHVTMDDFKAEAPEEHEDLGGSAILEESPNMIKKQQGSLNQSEIEGNYEGYYDEGLDEIEKNYTSEKFIHIDKFNNFMHHKDQLDQDLIEKLESEMMPFRKKVDDMEEVAEMEEDHSENLSEYSAKNQ